MAEQSASAGPVCLCGCVKAQHRQGRKSCLKCDCGEYDPATEAEPPAAVEAKAALHDMEVAFHHAERELKALRTVVAGVRHATGLGDLATNLPRAVDDIREARDRARAESSKLGEELAGALQRLAEYDSGASVDRLLHDADAVDLDRLRAAAAATRTAASILRDVLATAPRELELRAEAGRLRQEAMKVDAEIRRLIAGEPDRPQEPEPTDAEVREWAGRAGRNVPADGRVAKVHVDAYRKAHGLVSL